jgi:hypothetical protein
LSFALTRLVESQLLGVSATDPLTFVGVAGLLCVVALAASLVPARRAALVDPLVALRAELVRRAILSNSNPLGVKLSGNSGGFILVVAHPPDLD